MLNQRGQAFSVFELMIAAIVAIAILFVLLPIVNQPPNFGGNAKDEIGNSLASVDGGGNTTTREFSMERNDIVTGMDFSEKGFDQHSIVFAIESSLIDQGKFDPVEGDGYAGVKYVGSTNFNAKARVYCQQTGTDLQSIIDTAGIDDGIDMIVDPEDLCGGDGEYQPCCLVIVQRG